VRPPPSSRPQPAYPIHTFCAVGAPLAGRISDLIIVGAKKKRSGVWVPEDRLRASVPGVGLIVPVSLLVCGFCTQYVPGTLGIVLTLIFLFINGVGVRTQGNWMEDRPLMLCRRLITR